MSLTATRPPGLRTRYISRKTAGLSGARLMTQLLTRQSTLASASGRRSTVAWWKATFANRSWPALRRARSGISGAMSMPVARPACALPLQLSQPQDHVGLVRVAFQEPLVEDDGPVRPLHGLVDVGQLPQRPRVVRVQLQGLLQPRLRPRQVAGLEPQPAVFRI